MIGNDTLVLRIFGCCFSVLVVLKALFDRVKEDGSKLINMGETDSETPLMHEDGAAKPVYNAIKENTADASSSTVVVPVSTTKERSFFLDNSKFFLLSLVVVCISSSKLHGLLQCKIRADVSLSIFE